jgi:hypothetical protein
MNNHITIKEMAQQHDRTQQCMTNWINNRPDFPQPLGQIQNEKGIKSRIFNREAVNNYFKENPLGIRKKQGIIKKARYIPSQQPIKPDMNNLITQFLARPYGDKHDVRIS